MSSYALGVDVTEAGATAILIDREGQVGKHATGAGEAALRRILKQIGGPGAADSAGVAAEPARHPAVHKVFGAATPLLCSPGAAAITAETWVGAARGASDAICLWIGERVFAGVMLGGRPWAGAHGLAGSAAWLALNPVERQDYRKFGSLAAEVSNPGIARRLSWRIQSGDPSAVLERAGTLEAITAAHVFDGARDGDGVAISVVRETAKYVAMAIANLACTVDPEVVILAGGIADAGDLLMGPIAQECSRRLPPGMLTHFRLERSTLGQLGVAIGAAKLAAAAA
jgi:predicted NBD/HSP70 family sugar kinase